MPSAELRFARPSPATRIAYLTPLDASDVHAWSGIVHHMQRSLREAGAVILFVDRLLTPFARAFRLKKRFYRRVLHVRYDHEREPLVLRSWARQARSRLRNVPHDGVLSPSSMPVAHLRSRVPVAFWTDCTFAGVHNDYTEFSNLCGETVRHAHAAERAALTNVALALYCSDWAFRSAVASYGADPAKLHVVPFGANLTQPPAEPEIRGMLRARLARRSIVLLFIGVDWQRKRGDLVIEAAKALVRRGHSVRLDLVGSQPTVAPPPYVRLHGFVSKRTDAGRQLLDTLFKEATFFILPSRAECYGIALVEANAYAVPCLAADVGGIPTIIEHATNGFLLPRDATADDYARTIESALPAARYEALALNAFERTRLRLNWKAAGQQVLALFEAARASRAPAGVHA